MKLSMAAGCILFGAILAIPSFAQGNSNRDLREPGACSTRTLKGDYAFTVEGIILPPTGGQVPIRGVHLTHFDGKGALTQLDHLLIAGVPISPLDWTPVTGTYEVNSDCTGKMSLSSGGQFVNLKIVVGANGKQIYAIVTVPFDGPPRTVTSTGIKVE